MFKVVASVNVPMIPPGVPIPHPTTLIDFGTADTVIDIDLYLNCIDPKTHLLHPFVQERLDFHHYKIVYQHYNHFHQNSNKR